MVNKNRITLALLWPKYGGNVTSVNDLVKVFDKERFLVIFIYLRGRSVKDNDLYQAGHEVIYLSNKDRLSTFNLSTIKKLTNILKKKKVDILHCHAHKATVYGAIAAKLAGTKIVLAHVHGLGRSRNIKRKIMNFFILKKIKKVICVAEGVRNDVLKYNRFLSEDKVAVLENSVDYSYFSDSAISKEEAKKMLGLSNDDFVFGIVGRLAPTKGISFLINAFVKVKERIPSAQLVILGQGPSEQELVQQISETPCRNSIHFLGHREHINKLFKGMDVFVLSSIAEGMPRAILEAMAAGVPCIATKVGGIPEIINCDDVGILVESANSESLANAMISLAELPDEKLRQIAERANERVRKYYSHKVIGEKLRKLYEEEYERFLLTK